MRNQFQPTSTLIRFLLTLATVASLVEAKTTRPTTSSTSHLAKGVIIVIVVVVVVGLILCCVTMFCIFRCLRGRKSTQTTVAAPPETKTADIENQNYYAPPNTGGAAAYGQQPYDANAGQYGANTNQYETHQNEYNAGYNNTGYNAGAGYGAPAANAGYYNASTPGANASYYNASAPSAGANASYYNAGADGAGAGANASYYNAGQQTYAPPPGPPSMHVPPSTY